jgi:hypothetical protein
MNAVHASGVTLQSGQAGESIIEARILLASVDISNFVRR